MKIAFRWGCIVLSLITLAAWGLLLHQARQPWKLIGENGMSDAISAEPEAAADQPRLVKESVSVTSKHEIAPPGEGDYQVVDSILAQRQNQQQGLFEFQYARLLLMGPGPVAPKRKRHHVKKPTDANEDSSSEEMEESTSDNTASSADEAAESAALLVQTSPATSWNPVPVIPSSSQSGYNASLSVTKPTEGIVERITAPISATTDLTQTIISVTQPRLQGVLYSAPSTISQLTTPMSTTVGSLTSTFSTLSAAVSQASAPVTTSVSNLSSSSIETLTAQSLNTLSSPLGSVVSGSSALSTNRGSAVPSAGILGSGIATVSAAAPVSAPSAPISAVVPTTFATVTTAPPPTSALVSSVSGPVSTISSSLPPLAPTSLSSASSLLGSTTTNLPRSLPRGH